MKRFLFFVALVIVGLVIYALLSGEPPSEAPKGRLTSYLPEPTPTATPVPTTPITARPTASPTTGRPSMPPAPRPTLRPTVLRPPPAPPNDRSAEIERIIRRCAQRAGWRIVRYHRPRYGVSEVTGLAPSGDHVRSQRFLDELQNSGIIVDIDAAGGRPVRGRDGRAYIESKIVVKWR